MENDEKIVNMKKIETTKSESKEIFLKTISSESESVNISIAGKRLKHPKESMINEKFQHIIPISEQNNVDEQSTTMNPSDSIQFVSVSKSSTYNAWEITNRSTILPPNSELQQHAGSAQKSYMFDDLVRDNPSICNLKTLQLFQEITEKGEFTVQNYLGSGSYGVVLQIRSQNSGEVLAMKLYSSDPNDLRCYKERLAEMKVLQNLSHVNILPYYGFREYESHLGILLKFVDNGTLRDLMNARPISEELAANFTSQIVRGLDYLHKNECIHRDIKPSNILITSIGVIKIADFGSSTFLNERSTFNETHANTFKGTILYIAPEIFQRCEYKKECDIWSLGSVIFEMMTNKHICEETTKVGVYRWNRDLTNNILLPSSLSELSKDIIKKCLEINPAKRPSCDQLFKHEWFKEQESFRNWTWLQNLLEDDSDSKQDETELAQEALKQKAKQAESFCDKVRKRRNLLIFGLIAILITVSVVVVLCVSLLSRSTEKNSMSFEQNHIVEDSKQTHFVSKIHSENDNEKTENLKKDEREEIAPVKDNSNANEPASDLPVKIESKNGSNATGASIFLPDKTESTSTRMSKWIKRPVAFFKKHWRSCIFIIGMALITGTLTIFISKFGFDGDKTAIVDLSSLPVCEFSLLNTEIGKGIKDVKIGACRELGNNHDICKHGFTWVNYNRKTYAFGKIMRSDLKKLRESVCQYLGNDHGTCWHGINWSCW